MLADVLLWAQPNFRGASVALSIATSNGTAAAGVQSALLSSNSTILLNSTEAAAPSVQIWGAMVNSTVAALPNTSWTGAASDLGRRAWPQPGSR